MDIGRRFHKKRLSQRMLVQTNTNQIIEDLLKTGPDRMTHEHVAAKYKVCTKTISRINVKFVLSKGDAEIKLPEVDPQQIMKERKELTPLERLKLIDADGITVVELSLAAMRCMLESEIAAQTKLQKGETCKSGDLKPREITDFILAIAPFVLLKKDTPKGKANDKSGNVGNDIRQRWLDSQKNKPNITA